MKHGTIIRAPRSSEKPYFSTARVTAQDRNLSFEARGMLWYLLSKPDNWDVKPSDLEQQCGRSRVYRILKELKESGYLEYHEGEQDSEGKFCAGYYIVHEVPHVENQHTADSEPRVENQHTVSEEKPRVENQHTVPRVENQHVTYKRIYKDGQNTESTENRKNYADTPAAVSTHEPTPAPPIKLPTEQQIMFQAVCDVWGYTVESLTKSKRGQVGGVASELLGANARPEQLPAFKAWLDEKAKTDGWKTYTVNAMKTYWPDFVAENSSPPESDTPGIDPLFDPAVEGLSFEELNQRKLERSLRLLEDLKRAS